MALLQFGFEDRLLQTIARQEFERPTAIQMQAVPAAMLGRDVIGIAKTGSGKTAAFVWPMIVHMMDQPAME
jgi:ATP-dependent RNA helicase DDX42